MIVIDYAMIVGMSHKVFRIRRANNINTLGILLSYSSRCYDCTLIACNKCTIYSQKDADKFLLLILGWFLDSNLLFRNNNNKT